MPSFDISSEANMVNIKNAVDVSSRMVDNRYDFKGSSGKVELLEKEMTINVYGDSDFQLNQIKDILFPAMEKKEPDSSRRIVSNEIDKSPETKLSNLCRFKLELILI